VLLWILDEVLPWPPQQPSTIWPGGSGWADQQSTIWPGGSGRADQQSSCHINNLAGRTQYNTIQYNTILLYASKQYNTQDAVPQTVQLMPCTTRGAVCPRELEATGNSHTGGFPPAEGTVAVAENCSLRGAMALRSSLGQHNTIQYNTIQYQYNTGIGIFMFSNFLLRAYSRYREPTGPSWPQVRGGLGSSPHSKQAAPAQSWPTTRVRALKRKPSSLMRCTARLPGRNTASWRILWSQTLDVTAASGATRLCVSY
jgi:hypothetical protein